MPRWEQSARHPRALLAHFPQDFLRLATSPLVFVFEGGGCAPNLFHDVKHVAVSCLLGAGLHKALRRQLHPGRARICTFSTAASWQEEEKRRQATSWPRSMLRVSQLGAGAFGGVSLEVCSHSLRARDCAFARQIDPFTGNFYALKKVPKSCARPGGLVHLLPEVRAGCCSWSQQVIELLWAASCLRKPEADYVEGEASPGGSELALRRRLRCWRFLCWEAGPASASQLRLKLR